MADPKRQSTVGKVATPKLGPQGATDADTLSKVIGARVRLTTSLPDHVIEGTLFTADPVLNLVAIRNANSPPAPPTPSSMAPGNYHIIPISQIAAFHILQLPVEGDRVEGSGPGFEGAMPSISKVDMEALRQREENAIKEMKKFEASRGKGVSKEAQEIYDHIARTLPTRWDGTKIIVTDSVIVESPYGSENCKAPASKQSALPQIKRVVDGFWAKKKKTTPNAGTNPSQQTTGNSRPVPATPIPPRKGG